MSGHIATKRLYVSVWIALMCLTVATAAVSRIELGHFNIVLALLIATCKASLVALFFMGVKYISNKMTIVVIVAGLFWLGILLSLSMTDYLTRPWT